MIASPGDVSKERQIARAVIHEWNTVNSFDRAIVLLPVGWETHASPEMGDRAQAIINRTVLRDCDLLVAIFWTRLGSPTGTSPSGTVEEIEEHLAAGKPAMLYFSSAPVRPESIDRDQYEALLEFKERCKQRGLVEEYESADEFRDKFARQFAQLVIRDFGSTQDNASRDDSTFPQALLTPPLSAEAKELLLEAAKDSRGMILRMRTQAGISIHTNGRSFIEGHSRREEAKWEAALNELEQLQLVRDPSYKRSIFELTHEGYRIADLFGGSET